jgi:hypothetical protein
LKDHPRIPPTTKCYMFSGKKVSKLKNNNLRKKIVEIQHTINF